MHCPRCGQQQVSEETKFCSRCGFPLGLVSEILFHGGFLPQLADLPKNKKWLTRKNALKFALSWFLVMVFILAPISGIADLDDLAGFFAVIGTMGAIIMTIFSFLFLSKEKKYYENENILQGTMNQPAQFAGRTYQQNALPPQQAQPAQSYMPPPANSWKAPDTGELARPGSVTENTTKLLRKDE
jgi:cytochrome c biogenesis protein CcdA